MVWTWKVDRLQPYMLRYITMLSWHSSDKPIEFSMKVAKLVSWWRKMRGSLVFDTVNAHVAYQKASRVNDAPTIYASFPPLSNLSLSQLSQRFYSFTLFCACDLESVECYGNYPRPSEPVMSHC
jgi:hypothetical protein